MREGLLWYDNDAKKSLTDKVAEAAQAYQRKFGRLPDTCYLAPNALGRETPRVGLRPAESPGGDRSGEAGLRLVPSPLVRPHHFWVGVDRPPASP